MLTLKLLRCLFNCYFRTCFLISRFFNPFKSGKVKLNISRTPDLRLDLSVVKRDVVTSRRRCRRHPHENVAGKTGHAEH